MRVALLDPPSFTPPYDHALASALAARGHDVHLLTSRFLFAPTPEPDGYERHDVFFPLSGRVLARAPRARARRVLKGAEYLPSVHRLRRRLESLDPDVVHVQWLPLPRYDRRWVRSEAARRPLAITAHNALTREVAAQRERWLELWSLADRVVVHSRGGLEELAAAGVERRKLARIPHPIFAAPAGAEPAPPEGATLLFFGLVREHKGVDLLLRALPAIAAAVPEARLVVAGDEVESAAPLRRLADELGVAGRVDWRLRFVTDEEIPALLAAATAVVLPYRRGDASGVLGVALGHGRPAVVTDIGTLGETVREYGAGVVVPPEDADALAAGSIRLLAERGALADAYRGALAARESLTWAASGEAHERLYAAMAADRRVPA